MIVDSGYSAVHYNTFLFNFNKKVSHKWFVDLILLQFSERKLREDDLLVPHLRNPQETFGSETLGSNLNNFECFEGVVALRVLKNSMKEMEISQLAGLLYFVFFLAKPFYTVKHQYLLH